MTMTVKHLCDSCGAALQVDLDKQMYVCPFCGINYDYEYFREDDVYEKLRTALKKKEFNAAREAAEFLIAKDPHDFEALRGLFMASATISSLSTVVTEEFIDEITCERDILDRIVELAADDDKEYFSKCRDLVIKCSDYKTLRSSSEINDKHLENVSKKRSKLLDSKVLRRASGITFAVCIIFGIITLIVPKISTAILLTPHYLFLLVGSGFIFWLNINHGEKKMIAELDDAVKDKENRSEELNNNMEELMREMKIILHDIRKRNDPRQA